MNRANARSKSLTSTPRLRARDLQAPPAPPQWHRVCLTPAMRSRRAACCTGSSRLAAPKSMSARWRRRGAFTLPGCGRRGTRLPQHLLEERAQERVGPASAVAARTPAPVDLAHARAVEPLHDQHAGRAQVFVHERHPDVRVCRHRGPDRASVARPRSGSRALAQSAENSLTRSVTPYSRPTSSSTRPRGRAPRAPRDRRAPTRRSRPLTFTTTGEPSGAARVHLTDRRGRDRSPVEARNTRRAVRRARPRGPRRSRRAVPRVHGPGACRARPRPAGRRGRCGC